MTKERQMELLYQKWFDFKDYKENDYRVVFDYDALYIDDILLNVIHINDINFEEVIEELNYNKYEVIEQIIEDIESVGIDYVSMLGLGMSTKEWKTFIEENKKMELLQNYKNEIQKLMVETLGQFGEVKTIIDSDGRDITILLNEIPIIEFYQTEEVLNVDIKYLEEKCDGLSYELISAIGSICEILYIVKMKKIAKQLKNNSKRFNLMEELKDVIL